MTDLGDRLLHRNWKVRSVALREAVAQRAERPLVAALVAGGPADPVLVVTALGDLRRPGPADSALRQAAAASGPGTRDLRCASLVALAKRLGAAATKDLQAALAQKDSVVKEYAVMCLAAVGDAAAWEEVLDWLGRRRKASPVVNDPPTFAAAHYLLRHLPRRPSSDRDSLVVVLRRVWPILEADGVAAWLVSLWPEVQPHVQQASSMPGEVDSTEWRRKPLFAADAVCGP